MKRQRQFIAPASDDLPWWHEIIRTILFALIIAAMTLFLFGL